MSRLKHYKGDGWEVKVKYDEEMVCTVWKDRKGVIPPSKYYNIVNSINGNCQGIYFDYMLSFNHLIEHLDNLTKPKIINEKTFDNPNFKIRIWETEDKIGAKTTWIKEGFKYHRLSDKINISIANKYKVAVWSIDGWFYIDKSTNASYIKSRVRYTFTDLCKALERAEKETRPLTKRELFSGELNDLLDKYFGGSNQTKED